MVWIPEMARKRPTRAFNLRYQVSARVPPPHPDVTVAEEFRAAGLTASGNATDGWRLSLSGHTRVYGVISRDIDEAIDLRLYAGAEISELRLRCEPIETHAAHAAGLAGVLLIAFAVWVAGGLSRGVLPALTTVIAGSLLVEVTRQWAFDHLHRRLRRLVGDIGSALWPEIPAQIVDSPALLTGFRDEDGEG